MKKIQNFVETFGEGINKYLSEPVRVPCTILFYPYTVKNKICVDYCHFDERNLEELKIFTKICKEKAVNKIAFFGGYESEGAIPLLRLFQENGLTKLVDKDFVSFPPVKNLSFDTKGIVLESVNKSNTLYSFRELKDLFY